MPCPFSMEASFTGGVLLDLGYCELARDMVLFHADRGGDPKPEAPNLDHGRYLMQTSRSALHDHSPARV